MLPFHVAHSALSKKVGGLPAQVKSIYSVPQRISTNKRVHIFKNNTSEFYYIEIDNCF